MSELVEKLRLEFQDEEYRHAYAEECLNTMIATQIKVLREERELTQSALAEKSGMLQPRLSILEDANYSSWSIKTLRRLAQAFDVALSVKFETFSDLILEFEDMSRESLGRPSFKNDPMFKSTKVRKMQRRGCRNRTSEAEREALQGKQQFLFPNVVDMPGSETEGGPMGQILRKQGDELRAAS